jgi:hypothetical protein
MRWRVAVAGVLCAIPVGTAAHHSIAGVYDRDRPATLEAVVREWRFVNPHPRIVVEVAAASGEAQTWTLEMDNRWELAELGFTERTLEPGDRIVVRGSLGRRDPRALYVLRLEKPADDFTYEHHR